MARDLATIWAGIIALAVFAYVVMDGFDLGIGILFPGFAVGEERDSAMNAIAPVWDGNETWLVLGGGGLFAAFPLAYGILLPATYPLVVAMLLGLVFRGVAFEFRWLDPRHRAGWDGRDHERPPVAWRYGQSDRPVADCSARVLLPAR